MQTSQRLLTKLAYQAVSYICAAVIGLVLGSALFVPQAFAGTTIGVGTEQSSVTELNAGTIESSKFDFTNSYVAMSHLTETASRQMIPSEDPILIAQAVQQEKAAQAALEQARAQAAAESEAASHKTGYTITPHGDEEAFVRAWGERINAYLAGSALDGYGETFARAAYRNGVDPRLSPAISFVESSRGAVCYRPYNAWGWGKKSFSSWEQAIDEHIAGVSRIYGANIDAQEAKKYCPPSQDGSWYNKVQEQMKQI